MKNSEIIGKCKKFSMLGDIKLTNLMNCVENVNNNNVDGSLIACGVWKGGGCMVMLYSQLNSDKTREIFIYDTFEGMTKPSIENDDKKANDVYNSVNSGTYKRPYDKWHTELKWAYCPLDTVKENIFTTNYPKNMLHFIKGNVMETLNENIPEIVAIVHLDTDFYDSTKKELDVFFPKLSKGGWIIIDDYNTFTGCKKATEEFIMKHKNEIKIMHTKPEVIIQKLL